MSLLTIGRHPHDCSSSPTSDTHPTTVNHHVAYAFMNVNMSHEPIDNVYHPHDRDEM